MDGCNLRRGFQESMNRDVACEFLFHSQLPIAGSFIRVLKGSACPGHSEQEANSLASLFQIWRFPWCCWAPMMVLKSWAFALDFASLLSHGPISGGCRLPILIPMPLLSMNTHVGNVSCHHHWTLLTVPLVDPIALNYSGSSELWPTF
jgi:hypothetical protein